MRGGFAGGATIHECRYVDIGNAAMETQPDFAGAAVAHTERSAVLLNLPAQMTERPSIAFRIR